MATDPNAAIYDAIRQADAAGDSASVARLAGYLKQTQSDVPVASSQAAPSGPDYLPKLQQMIEQGAQRPQIEEFARAQGVDPSKLTGIDEAIAYASKNPGKPISAAYQADAEHPATALDGPAPRQLDDGTAGATARGAADSLTLGLAPRLFAVGDMVNNATGGLTGPKTDADGYSANLELERERQASDEEHHQAARLTGELLGGIALPAGMEGVAFTAGKDALRGGATLAEARAIAAHAATQRAAAVGAAYGGAYGFNDNYGSAGERLAGAGIGAAEGALGGLAFGKAGEALAPRLDAARVAARALPVPEGQQVAEAAARQGLEVLPADVGGPNIRTLTSGIAKTPFGAGPIVNKAKALNVGASNRKDEIASALGSAMNPESMGQDVRGGLQSYLKSSREEAQNFYRPAEKATEGVTVDAPKALDAIDEELGRMKDTPGGALGQSYLEAVRDRLAEGNLSVAGLRGMRTEMRRQFIKDGLANTNIERIVGSVMNKASEDVSDGLRSQGLSEAAAKFKAGDALWRQRADTIKNVLTPIIGKDGVSKSGEAITKTVMADLKGNNARTIKLLNSLPPEQQGNVRASIIASMGKDASGENFSLAKFLTNWKDMGETAKAAVFGAEQRAAMNDLQKVAKGSAEAQRYNNFSNTGGVTETGRLLTNLTAIPTLGVSVLGQYGISRLLASPRMVRWLARAPKTALSNSSYIERLSRIARAEPAIANDVLNLQSRLTEALSQSPARAAANEGDNKGNGVQRNDLEQ